jgi:hypothetical protein
MACTPGSLFGASDKYIKFYNSDLVAIEGPNTIEKQILNDLRIPYSQLLRSRIVLKAGQVNYLLNHLGLGDNATFLSIVARYDDKSKIEEDNYVQYNYYLDLSKNYYMDQILILTGNSTHRIPQLYLTNPNATHSVKLDVLVAIIDDTYSFFGDDVNQSGILFTQLTHDDIQTYITDESIVILDSDGEALAYINLTSITSIEINGLMVTIQETNIGKIYLEFTTSFEALQSYSLLNYLLNNLGDGIVINDNNTFEDTTPPVMYFNLTVGATVSGATISMSGATVSGPYNTSLGASFSTYISLSQFGSSNTLLKSNLNSLLIDEVTDNIDGSLTINDSNIILKNYNSTIVNSITSTGTYSVTFDIKDYAGNSIDNDVTITLGITS